jgi:hypothetical protein
LCVFTLSAAYCSYLPLSMHVRAGWAHMVFGFPHRVVSLAGLFLSCGVLGRTLVST